jgi:hypothetical protein
VFDAPTQVGQTWNFALGAETGVFGGFTELLPSALTPGATSGFTFFGSTPVYDTYGNLVTNYTFGVSSPSGYYFDSTFGTGPNVVYAQTAQITYIGQNFGYDFYLVNGYNLINGTAP